MIRSYRRFLGHSGGNISMMFAAALLTLLGAGGYAVDISRYSSARSVLSAAADAGTLAGASHPGTQSEREAAARQVFTANLQQAGYPYPVTVTYTNLTDRGSNAGFRIDATAQVAPVFGRLLGNSATDIATMAQAKSGTQDATEISFVLDTTDSMEGDRIVNLKLAANSMLDQILARTNRPDLLKVGVVPFAQYVNVGMGYRNAPWIDVAADYQTPIVPYSYTVYDQIGTTNCRNVSYPAEPFVPPGQCMRDGRPRECGGSPGRPARTENICDPVYSTTPRTVTGTSGGDWVRWEGCVGSRAYPLETQDGSYGTRIPGILGLSCATPVQDLTTDISSVRSTINGLNTMGETYLPAGLIWGKRMLSPGEPFSASSTPGTRKFLILVTDGRNTKSPTYPNHDGSDGVLADQLTRETCQNIANDTANPIRVFTVAFEMDGLATKTILQDCAMRTNGQFFDATDAARLNAAFGEITGQIFAVRLTK